MIIPCFSGDDFDFIAASDPAAAIKSANAFRVSSPLTGKDMNSLAPTRSACMSTDGSIRVEARKTVFACPSARILLTRSNSSSRFSPVISMTRRSQGNAALVRTV